MSLFLQKVNCQLASVYHTRQVDIKRFAVGRQKISGTIKILFQIRGDAGNTYVALMSITQSPLVRARTCIREDVVNPPKDFHCLLEILQLGGPVRHIEMLVR